jgi:predicted transcriptional regulator
MTLDDNVSKPKGGGQKVTSPSLTEDEFLSVSGKLLSSDIKVDVLKLFHGSPGLIDTLDGIALRIGRKRSEIGEDVTALLELGVLLKKQIGKSEVIYFDTAKDSEIQEKIAERLRRRVE